MRNLLGIIITPALVITGYRFDKSFRHAECGWKAIVYKHVDVVGANLRAGLDI